REAILDLEITGISHDAEVWPATDLVHGIDRLIRPLLEVGTGRSDKMAACREADHTDAIRIDSPFRGLAANQTHGSLGVFQRPGRRLALPVAGPSGASVFENDPGHAERIQPLGDFSPFLVPSQVVVPAAGTNERCCSRVLVFGGPINGEGGLGYIGQ